MSYCRFLEGDVYAYVCDGGVQFWIAGEGNRHLDRLCNTYGDAYQYIKELREEHGLDVPSYAVDALREDAIEEASRICEPIVDELQSENARLRELISEPIKCDSCEAMLDCDECLRADVSHKRVRSLEAENAKLRELVDAWMGCGTRYHTMQGGCPMYDADAEDFCKAASLARELGIEVD